MDVDKNYVVGCVAKLFEAYEKLREAEKDAYASNSHALFNAVSKHKFAVMNLAASLIEDKIDA